MCETTSIEITWSVCLSVMPVSAYTPTLFFVLFFICGADLIPHSILMQIHPWITLIIRSTSQSSSSVFFFLISCEITNTDHLKQAIFDARFSCNLKKVVIFAKKTQDSGQPEAAERKESGSVQVKLLATVSSIWILDVFCIFNRPILSRSLPSQSKCHLYIYVYIFFLLILG